MAEWLASLLEKIISYVFYALFHCFCISCVIWKQKLKFINPDVRLVSDDYFTTETWCVSYPVFPLHAVHFPCQFIELGQRCNELTHKQKFLWILNKFPFSPTDVLIHNLSSPFALANHDRASTTSYTFTRSEAGSWSATVFARQSW